MDNLAQNLKDFLMDLFFPSFCFGCKKEGSYLCYDCKTTLDISEYNYCLCSKNPLRLAPESKNGKCSRCQNLPAMPAHAGQAGKKLSGLYSALPYKEKFLTKKLIYQFKYPPHIKSLAKSLSEIILEHLVLAKNMDTENWENSILVPVPLEKSRLKERGYNQSEELAKEIGHNINVPLVLDNLVKIKKTKPQMELSAKERQENIKNAFLIKNPAEFFGKKIFLVDDVYTTGATMEECARILKNTGAKKVWGIVIAREG